MDKQKEMITELTLDQMDGITGGTDSGENFGRNEDPFHNRNNTDILPTECLSSPNGTHVWRRHDPSTDVCHYCGRTRHL